MTDHHPSFGFLFLLSRFASQLTRATRTTVASSPLLVSCTMHGASSWTPYSRLSCKIMQPTPPSIVRQSSMIYFTRCCYVETNAGTGGRTIMELNAGQTPMTFNKVEDGDCAVEPHLSGGGRAPVAEGRHH